MPKGQPTSMFFSSTCYDLSQVRADLGDFATAQGFEPVLSELSTFPVNTSEDTLSNCLEVVRDRADIFVLIVGGRYGYIGDSGKSITNLEFLEATAKGIPRYVFIKRDIIALLPIWKANPDADFSATVDTPKLFQFVSELRNSGEIWVFPFDSAQDITQALRRQLSYLLAECLTLRSRLVPTELSSLLRLGPQTLRIYIEKPPHWEYKAFARALPECLRSHKSKRLDYELGISYGDSITIQDAAALSARLIASTEIVLRTVDMMSKAVNEGLKVAMGPPGVPGDIFRIWHSAERIADGYSRLLDWALDFDRIDAPEEFKPAVSHTRNLVSDIIPAIEEYSESLFERINEKLRSGEGDGNFTLKLTIGEQKLDALVSELRQLTVSAGGDFDG
ncbi:DUF4062 domain-containing protein [Pseudorhodoferax sp.]|uniref:DUF4062 domain-containing protein n=1 Tax=Pseudorhodoferax sp. TaxID=1993553 RepID=UPI002DD66B2F|nr:DUF4062 domain-containing protein [Pseudorhodoferax sp.]